MRQMLDSIMQQLYCHQAFIISNRLNDIVQFDSWVSVNFVLGCQIFESGRIYLGYSNGITFQL